MHLLFCAKRLRSYQCHYGHLPYNQSMTHSKIEIIDHTGSNLKRVWGWFKISQSIAWSEWDIHDHWPLTIRTTKIILLLSNKWKANSSVHHDTAACKIVECNWWVIVQPIMVRWYTFITINTDKVLNILKHSMIIPKGFAKVSGDHAG